MKGRPETGLWFLGSCLGVSIAFYREKVSLAMLGILAHLGLCVKTDSQTEDKGQLILADSAQNFML